MTTLAAGSLTSTIVASVLIYPHYLAYFNWASGGPGPHAGPLDRQQSRLGAGPGRTPALVEGKDPRPADRAGLFRPDQPVDLPDAG